MKSNLQMKNLYFKKIVFDRKPLIEDGEYEIEISKEIRELGNHEYVVSVTTIIDKEDLRLELEASAEFLLDTVDDTRIDSIIQNNTVAIMFPFIRSQVTLMTSQPNMSPIILPTINTAKLK
ncbi:MAG: protein-export chaperone SecB [Eubacteriales bacterium]